MLKKSILDYLAQNRGDVFLILLKKFMETQAVRSKLEVDEISGVDFISYVISVTQGVGSLQSYYKLELLQDPFWLEFLGADAHLLWRGIDLPVINRLRAYPFVDLKDLLARLKETFKFRVADQHLRSIKTAWELLILTGKPEGIDAAIKDHGLKENSLASGHNPLEIAVLSGSCAQLECLIEKIPGLLKSSPDGAKAIQLAALTLQQDMAAALIKKGVSVDAAANNTTALCRLYDEVYGNVKGEKLKQAEAMAEFLYQNGARLANEAAFSRLAIRKPGIAHVLMRHGLDVNACKIDVIRHAMDLHMYDVLKLFFDYGLRCTEQELRDAGLTLHLDFLANEYAVALKFRKENNDPGYWYCLGMITNSIDHFRVAAEMGMPDARLRMAGIMLSRACDETLPAIDKLINESLKSLPDKISENEYAFMNQLQQIANELEAFGYLPETRARCFELIAKNMPEGGVFMPKVPEVKREIPAAVVAAPSVEQVVEKPVEKPVENRTSSRPTLFAEKPKETPQQTSYLWSLLGYK